MFLLMSLFMISCASCMNQDTVFEIDIPQPKAAFSIDHDGRNALVHFALPTRRFNERHQNHSYETSLISLVKKRACAHDIDLSESIVREINAMESGLTASAISINSTSYEDEDALYICLFFRNLWSPFQYEQVTINKKTQSCSFKKHAEKLPPNNININRFWCISDQKFLLEIENRNNNLILYTKNIEIHYLLSRYDITRPFAIARHPDKKNIFYFGQRADHNLVTLSKLCINDHAEPDLSPYDQFFPLSKSYIIQPSDSTEAVMLQADGAVAIIKDMPLMFLGNQGIKISLQDAQHRLAIIARDKKFDHKRAAFITDLIKWSYFKQWKQQHVGQSSVQ